MTVGRDSHVVARSASPIRGPRACPSRHVCDCAQPALKFYLSHIKQKCFRVDLTYGRAL